MAAETGAVTDTGIVTWSPPADWRAGSDRVDGLLHAGSVVIGLVAAAAALAFAVKAPLRLDGYGLVGSLPPAYYVALAALPFASALEWLRGASASNRAIVAHVVLFVVVVWLTPLILEGTPRFRTSYTNYGYVDPLVRGVGLLPSVLIYHNWPLFPTTMAFVVEAGVPPLVLLAIFPIAIMLAYLVPLAYILRTLEAAGPGPFTPTSAFTRGIGTAWPLGLWIFAIFDWTSQDYFSPQALAFFLFLVWLCVVLRVIRQGGEPGLGSTIVLLELFAVIVVTHLLTSLEMLGVLATLVGLRLIRRPSLLIVCALIFIVWQVDGAWPFFRFYGDRLQATLLDVVDFFSDNVTSRVTGSQPHAEIAALRIAVTIVVFGLAGLAVLLAARRRAQRRAVLAGLAVLVGIMIVAPASVYGGEMMIRVLLFSLPMLGAIIAASFWRPPFRLLVMVVLVAMAPIHVLTHYGNEEHDYVSPGEIAGFAFVDSALPPANVFGGYPGANFQNTALLDARNSYLSRSTEPSTIDDFLNPELRHVWDHPDWPIYVVVSRGDDVAMQLFQDRLGFIPLVRRTLDASDRFVVVYRNPDVTVYRWLPTISCPIEGCGSGTGRPRGGNGR
jgi:hypothetical protein